MDSSAKKDANGEKPLQHQGSLAVNSHEESKLPSQAQLSAYVPKQDLPPDKETQPNITEQLPQSPAKATSSPNIRNSAPQQVPRWVPNPVPISNLLEMRRSSYPQRNQNSTGSASTPRPTMNDMYNPAYRMLGLPVDPHLRALFEKQARGEKW